MKKILVSSDYFTMNEEKSVYSNILLCNKKFILLIFTSFLFLAFVTLNLESKFLGYDDVYEYLAYAQSYFETGEVRNIAINPSLPPVTTQLGVAYFIFLPLIIFGASLKTTIFSATIIAHLNLIIIFFLSYKVTRIFCNRTISRTYCLSLILSYPVWAYYGSPLNEGFQTTLFLLGFLLVHKTVTGKWNFQYAFLFLIIVFLGYLFRVQTIILPLALVVFYLVEKKIKKSVMSLSTAAIVVLCAHWFSSLFIKDFSLTQGLAIHGLTQLQQAFHSPLKVLVLDIPTKAIGPTLIGTSYFAKNGNLIYTTITVLLSGWIAWTSLRLFLMDRKYRILVLCMLGSILFLLISPVIINRYVSLILPLLWITLTLGFYRYFRYTHLVILLITLSMTLTRAFFIPPYVSDLDSPKVDAFKQCVYQYEPILGSDHAHFTYFDLEQKIMTAGYKLESYDYDSLIYFSRKEPPAQITPKKGFASYFLPRINMRSGLGIDQWGYILYVHPKSKSFSCFSSVGMEKYQRKF